MGFRSRFEKLLHGDPFRDRETFVRHFEYGLVNRLTRISIDHVKKSAYVQKGEIRYSEDIDWGSHTPPYKTTTLTLLPHVPEKEFYLKVAVRGHPRYAEFNTYELSKEVLSDAWNNSELLQLKEKFSKGGSRYVLSTITARELPKLYKELDFDLSNIHDDVQKIEKPLTPAEREVARKKLQDGKRKAKSTYSSDDSKMGGGSYPYSGYMEDSVTLPKTIPGRSGNSFVKFVKKLLFIVQRKENTIFDFSDKLKKIKKIRLHYSLIF